ncbi:MAG: histone-like nucleoid-structuring protein Lsr2, partial [Streptosporangiaceae bacterium]
MAQRTQVVFLDDIDGSAATGTARFGLGGTEYEIDLSPAHAAELAAAMGPYIAAARKVASAKRPVRGGLPRVVRHDHSDVRAWARDQGLKISDRGRIPGKVLAQYEAA